MQGVPKYIVAATPRAATAYIAELLDNLGLGCRHEGYFKFEQCWHAFLDAEQIVGDATWLAVPFLARMPATVRILHQTRHPLKVIRSLLRIQFLEFDEHDKPVREGLRLRFTEFACHHCPQVLEHQTTLERTMWFYYYWNKMIDDVAAERDVLRYDIENLGPDRIRQILDYIGVQKGSVPDEMLVAQHEVLPHDINAKEREKVELRHEVTWEALPPEVQELARSYGYGPPGAAEAVPGWRAELARAQEDVRKHARILQRVWSNERTALTGELSESLAKLRVARSDLDRLEQELTAERETQAPSDLARRDDRESRTARQDRVDWMCRLAQGPRVLDAGCGRGSRALILGREGLDVTAIDGDVAAVQVARATLAAEPEQVRQRVRFESGTLFTAEFEPGSFDSVLMADLLTQVTNPVRLLEQTRACLVDGGRLVACVPLGYHAGRNRVQTYYAATLLHLLQEHFSIVDFNAVYDHLCVVATRPAGDERPEPLAGDALTAWNRTGVDALLRTQRRRARELTELRKANRALARAHDESARTERELQQKLGEAEAQLESAATALVRAQALQIRLAHANPESRDWALTVAGRGPVRPTQQAGGFLFFCVNGAGLGHLTRALAIARRIRRIDPGVPIYFLSSSQALQIISREGMIAYHIPPRSEYGDQVGGNAWNELLLQTLRMIVGMHRPAVLVYDGVSPYAGLLNAISECRFVHTAMILRLRHKHDRLQSMIDRLERFDQIIFPGEQGLEVPPKLAALNHRVFDPIVFLDPEEVLPREEARRHWRIRPDRKAVYLQLGAGNIDDTAPWIKATLAALSGRKDVEVVLAESPISRDSHAPRPGVHILHQYPNSLFAHGFDLAITAVGYNTFHELMHFGVPSVLIPNQKTVTDDQVARALMAQDASAARVVLKTEDLEGAIAECLRDDVARALRDHARNLVPRNGALDVAQSLLAATSQRLAAPKYLAAAGHAPA